ncbi:hypothetical protein FB157_120112 [Streptomyces sp. BK340]|nr:hypothetical protein FB157_120112 [Streptomyces sp. BK340]
MIGRRLGIPHLRPLAPETWNEDTFYGLSEVFHDLVSRPRMRRFHDWNMCGWHHSEFHNGPARLLYRWKVNQLLREAGIEYELAAEGEDLGRLVAITDDARRTLVHRALNERPGRHPPDPPRHRALPGTRHDSREQAIGDRHPRGYPRGTPHPDQRPGWQA